MRLWNKGSHTWTPTESVVVSPSKELSLSVWKDSKVNNSPSLDILDLSPLIDIYAESEAVEAFDNEMGKERKWFFQNMKGFFARSFQRMGRDAWIDSKKRELIQDIRAGLKNGTYTESFLREHISAGDQGIVENAYLAHEKESKSDTLPKDMQAIVNKWIATAPDSPERKQKTEELKASIESNYPTVTVDLSQIEASLLRLEQAKISSEVDIIEAKLNFLDLGRIEQGKWNRKEWWFVKMADSMSHSINNSGMNDWLKQKLLGSLRHPNTAAVLTALGTRAGVAVIAGSTVAAGFAGGFLLPIVAGSAAWGLFAGVRARREMRDRTAQIDRRGAMGLETGNTEFDGLSSGSLHMTQVWQAPVSGFYERVYAARNDVTAREDALIAGTVYLVRHLVGREHSLNMLQYDADISVSRQHVSMIRLMNEVFPGLVATFNDGTLQSPDNKSHEAEIIRNSYIETKNLVVQTLQNRQKEEGIYALKQGAIFGTAAAVIGGTIWVAVHEIMSLWSGQAVEIASPASSVTHYPDHLIAYKDVHRWFWYDNGTPAPRFDHTELMARTDTSGKWNISHLLNKTATALPNHAFKIEVGDLTGKNIQALVTPIKGGPSFLIPIDSQGNIEIPSSMQSAFGNRTFAWMEVGEVKVGTGWRIDLNPMLTVVGKGNMVFDTITETIPGAKQSTLVHEDTGWWAIPFGGNPYQGLGKKNPKDRIKNIMSDEPQTMEDIWENTPIKTPLVLPPPAIEPTGLSDTPPTIALGWPTPPDLLPKPTDDSPQADMLQLERNKEKDMLRLEWKWAIPPLGIGYKNEKEEQKGTPEKQEKDTLWNEIVKIRQILESRNTGDIALSEATVLNMQDTLTKLLSTYHGNMKNWNEPIANVQAISPSDTGVDSVIMLPYEPNTSMEEQKKVSDVLVREKSDKKLQDEYEVVTRILSSPYVLNDNVIQQTWLAWHENDPKFILKWENHSSTITQLLRKIKDYNSPWALRAINALYARNGKIWLSNTSNQSLSNIKTGNIALGLGVQENDRQAQMNRRLYESTKVDPMPDTTSITLLHELGHQIIYKYSNTANNAMIQDLRKEFSTLRDSDKDEYSDSQFREDMSELMGLYLMWREYVMTSLDDRIKTRKSRGAYIPDGLRDHMMNTLDAAYLHYIG